MLEEKWEKQTQHILFSFADNHTLCYPRVLDCVFFQSDSLNRLPSDEYAN